MFFSVHNLKELYVKTLEVESSISKKRNFNSISKIEKIQLISNHLPAEFRFYTWKITNLKNLDLSYNCLNVLHKYFFFRNHRLQMLDLSYNNLNNLPEDIFQYNQFLKYLDLSYNEFDHISSDPLWNFFQYFFMIFLLNFMKKLVNFQKMFRIIY